MRNSTALWFMERDITTFENSLEGIVSKRKHSRNRCGRSPDWLKMENPNALAVKREEEDRSKRRWK
jgi:ATP-dependent DNA ligase